MAPKKASKQGSAPPAEGLDRKRFERELRNLTAKAKMDSESRKPAEQAKVIAKAALLLALTGTYAVMSQKAMSPVYGDIPSAVMHTKLLMANCFIGWAGNLFLRNTLSVNSAQLLPLLAAYIPVVQFYLYSFSGTLGAQWGPAITESLTLGPLCVLTASAVADCLEDADLSFLPQSVADAAPGLGSWAFFKLMRHAAGHYFQKHAGRSILFTRVGLETLLGGLYAVAAPSKFLWLAAPALLHTAFFNTHAMTPMATTSLNNTMAADGWLLLDRRESVTGYISVLESVENGFRVLRCDHSLLGGEWVSFQGQQVQEPIYGVFVMLEAVRLVKRDTRIPDRKANALVVYVLPPLPPFTTASITP